ncbi:hypothetical protein [Lihuaxuella thermophila]|uniref:Uncharacterized protein n=1 Tax=Lihuaxuella thermophila TaxID=1173111 RepID=A0A1H8AVP9_9BACL|nr:hypothetical protein [Lihuaxuella thermophila]SEM73587.1 hypothetical protein SAMN05444955_101324 [Lihuaxuella thermophila]
MKITVNLTKAELDLIEEALLQYQNLLLKSESQDEMVSYELGLLRRVLEEFGMEELEEDEKQRSNLPAHRPNPYPAPQQQYSAPNPYHGSNYPAPNQYPFSR